MLRILLLEDDANDAELVRRRLAELGPVSLTRVSSRDDFEAALLSGQFDVLLADYRLPGFNGLSALQIAQHRCPEAPFIFVSGTVSEEAAVEAMQLGAQDYVMKDRPQRLPMAIQRAIERANDRVKALRAQRMDNVGAVASGVAHDINNILSEVMIAHTLVQPHLSAEDRRIIDTAQARCRRGGEMVKQITTFLRGANGKVKRLEVPVLVQELADFIRSTFPRNVEIHVRVAKPISPVEGNATQIHQVLLNFCVNARDAMPGGGVLDIGADQIELSEYLPRTATTPISGRYVRLIVRDDGCGMSEKTAAKIFEPFFTTKEPGKGTGLGLSIAVSIARSHRGFIDLMTMEGRGSTFSLLLPAATGEVEGHQAAQQMPAGNGQTILLVDDEVGLLEITRTLLESFNYRILAASNGIEALRIYHQRQKEIFAVVTDLMMPIMDGKTFIERLRQIKPAIKIVCLSGGPKPDALSPTAWLDKPYTPEQLLTTLAGL